MARIYCSLWNSPMLMNICLQMFAITENAAVNIFVTCVFLWDTFEELEITLLMAEKDHFSVSTKMWLFKNLSNKSRLKENTNHQISHSKSILCIAYVCLQWYYAVILHTLTH